MIKRVKNYIEQEHLFELSDSLLVALSGGADSVALLRVLHKLGYRVMAAHCNFHLRGAESDRDEAFVRQLCESLRIPLQVTHFDTEQYAHQHGESIEMAARNLRYQWFDELLKQHQLSYVAVAHHRDDSIETFFINLLRGAGIHGLTGIKPKNGRVVRPLLNTDRSEILHFLEEINQDYVTDSTNLQTDYLRNKIRLEALPMFEKLNPSFRDVMAKNLHHLQVADALIEQVCSTRLAESCKKEGNVEKYALPALMRDDALQMMLYARLREVGFNAKQIQTIVRNCMEGEPGKIFTSTTHELTRTAEQILLRPLGHSETLNETYNIQIVDYHEGIEIPRNKFIACLDADKLQMPLTFRQWKQGDRFVPFGMKGSKLVSDYMTDRKFSAFQKQEQQVAISGNDIVWLVEERIDNRYAVTADTRRIVLIEKRKG